MTKFSIKTGLMNVYEDGEFLGYHEQEGVSVLDKPEYESFILGGYDYLHFSGLEIFDRCEDADKGQKIQIFGGEINVTENLNGNPSSRRGAVSLYFASECGPCIRLNIIQHKGLTDVEFELWDGKKPKI